MSQCKSYPSAVLVIVDKTDLACNFLRLILPATYSKLSSFDRCSYLRTYLLLGSASVVLRDFRGENSRFTLGEQSIDCWADN